MRKITRLSHSQPKREFPSFYIFPCWIHLRMWMSRKETRTFLAINAFCFQTHSDSFANLHFPFINCVWRKKIFFIFPVDDKVAGASRTKLLELLSMLRWFIVLSSSFTKVRLAVNLLSLEWRHEWKKHFLLPASQRSVGFWNYQRVDTHNSHSRRRFDIKISSSSFFSFATHSSVALATTMNLLFSTRSRRAHSVQEIWEKLSKSVASSKK